MLRALIVALVAGSTIGLELIQTRVLSVLYYNHVVYLTVTIALMGFGISGVLVSLYAKTVEHTERYISRLLLAFAISQVACLSLTSYLPLWLPDADPITKLFLSYLLLVVPFLFSGATLGLIFMTRGKDIHTLYGADLAASALVVIIFGLLIQPLGANSFIVLCAGAALTAFILHGVLEKQLPSRLALSIAIIGVAVATQPLLISSQPERYKTAGRFFDSFFFKQVSLENSAWTTINKIDVWSSTTNDVISGRAIPEAANRKMITQDADAHTILWGPQRLDELKSWANKGMPYPSGAATLAYLLKPSIQNSLVIGVGGGNDIITARAYGANKITGVELNPATVKFVTGPYREFASWPNWDGVELVRAEGRNYVRGHKKSFDTFVMSGVDTFSALNSGAYVLSENYLYTVEAIHDYLNAMKDDGIVAIYRWFFYAQPRESLRLANLVATALEARGVRNIQEHIMVVGESDWAVTLFRPTPFSETEVRNALEIVKKSDHLAMVFIPKVFAEKEQEALEKAAYHKDTERLAVARKSYAGLLGSSGVEKEKFLDAYPYLVTPVYDSRPFFFEYAKDNGSALDVDLSKLRGNAVRYTLHIMLFLLTSFSLLAMLGPLVLKAREGVNLPGTGLLCTFFSSLGIGFMMIEIGLMQWLNLFIGDPMHSLMVVLGGLLLFAGMGSLISGYWNANNQRKISVSMIAVGCIAPLWLMTMSWLVPSIADSSFVTRVTVALLSLLPLGMLMGIPFASGLSYLEKVNPRFVPWAWGINGLTSVMASILVIIMAMRFGFNSVILIGAAVYFLGALVISWHSKRYI